MATALYRVAAVAFSGILFAKQKLVLIPISNRSLIFQKWQCAGPQNQIQKSTPLFLGKKIYKGLLLPVNQRKLNGQINLEKHQLLVIKIPKDGPDLATVHKFDF